MEESEVLRQFRQIIDGVKEKRISPTQAQARLYELAGELEMDQWHIIDNLRTRAPDDEKELAREIAELIEAELRKGSGNG
jgi:Asp-tRNA(Asn)/Glu-tRNA(Gln) amidotransferase B subunit